MELVKITSRHDPWARFVPALYESAFPDDERTSTDRLLRMIDECPEMTFNVIVEGNTFAGMAVIWELDLCRYLLYLAITEKQRNRQLGSQTLQALLTESPLPIIGEVERPINEMNVKRIAFYRRNGFHVETEYPMLLNAAHAHPTCILQLISSQRLTNTEACQQAVIDTVYAALHCE